MEVIVRGGREGAALVCSGGQRAVAAINARHDYRSVRTDISLLATPPADPPLCDGVRPSVAPPCPALSPPLRPSVCPPCTGKSAVDLTSRRAEQSVSRSRFTYLLLWFKVLSVVLIGLPDAPKKKPGT